MAARTSYVSDGVFSVLMSFIFAGIFGLGIGFAYAELQGGGWAAGLMIAGVVAVIGGAVLSMLLSRKPLPPPNTVKAPTAPARGAHFVAGGATGATTGATAGGGVSETLASARDTVARAFDSAGDKVREAAATTGERFDEATGAVAGKVSGAAESASEAADTANQRVRDAAKAAGEAARLMAEPTAEGSADAAADDDAPRGTKPALLAAAREGGADDLKKIKGVGPKLEESLNEIGVWHFDQIASWNADEVAWIDTHLVQFKGRCSRDEWVAQAKVLAEGGETDFSQRVDKGDVY